MVILYVLGFLARGISTFSMMLLKHNLLLEGECTSEWFKNGKNYSPYGSKQDF
jgi:hypothetical protein